MSFCIFVLFALILGFKYFVFAFGFDVFYYYFITDGNLELISVRIDDLFVSTYLLVLIKLTLLLDFFIFFSYFFSGLTV